MPAKTTYETVWSSVPSMQRILVINGPNLNNLGKRDESVYGRVTLSEIESSVRARADALGIAVDFYQSNHEGALIDWVQDQSVTADGIVLNAGALTQIGYPLLDALLDAGLPFVEVHLSNIHAREEFRRKSVFAAYAKGQIAGLGWQGYVYAVEHLAESLA